MEAGTTGTVGRSYTKGRRQPYLIRKWPGSNWALPLGPYTITQLLVFVGSVYFLLTYRDLWAHFGPFNLIIGVGMPLVLTYVTRHTRIEGRDPLRAGIALAALMLQPRTGYLGDDPHRAPKPVHTRGGRFPVAQLPPGLVAYVPPPPPPPAGRVPAPAGAGRAPTPVGGGQPFLADLLQQVGRPGSDAGQDNQHRRRP